MTPQPRVSYNTHGNSWCIWEFLTRFIGQGPPLEQRKKDNGQLLLLHPSINFLADKNHHVRAYAKHCFILAYKQKALTCCTPNDAECMQRNFLYFIWSTTSLTTNFVGQVVPCKQVEGQ
jgi:hypothetical protein